MPSIRPFPLTFTSRLTVGLLLCAALAGRATADPMQDGLTASQRGDFAVAYCLWRPLADQGDAEAQYHLAWLYANGQGLRQDPRSAADWWHKAAQQGHIDAQAALGSAYLKGRGRSKDEQKAVHWLASAAQGGNDEALARLRTMAGRGSKPAVATVEKLADERDWDALGGARLIKSDAANLREKPNTSARIVGKLSKGDQVVILATRRDWLRVAVMPQGQQAWIYRKLVAPEDS